MRTYNTHYLTASEFKHFVQTHGIIDGHNLLIQIFTAVNSEQFIARMLYEITALLPSAHIIGSTTDGEIVQNEVTENTTVVSITVFENTQLYTTHVARYDESVQAGVLMAQALIQEDVNLLITFTDGLHCNGEEYLQGITSVNKNIKIAGGMAGDYAKFESTYVFTKDAILSHGAVGVALKNKDLKIYTDYSFNWYSIGRDMLITHAQRNRVYTIDGIVALDVYKKYLGEDTVKELPAIGIEYPMIIQRGDNSIARALLAVHEDGSVSFAGNIAEGDIVHFGYGNDVSIINYSIQAYKKLLNQSVESIFLYSCMARRRFMPDLIEQEISPFSNIAPTAGFFTYGEFYSGELLNQTLTILAISENELPITQMHCVENIQLELSNYQKSMRALSHLLNTTIVELNIENSRLTQSFNELNTREEALRLAQEIGHFGSWEIDLFTNETTWSDETYKIYRTSKDLKPTLESFLNRIVEVDKAKAALTLQELRDGKIKSIELHVRRDDGIVINVLLNGKMVFNADGMPVKIIGTTLDITELSTLKEFNRELNQILERAGSEIYIIDTATYTYQYVNNQAIDALGYSFEEMLQMNVFDINPTITTEKIDFLKKEVDEKGHVLSRTIHRKKDGSLYHAQSYIHYTKYMGKDVAIAFDLDITELVESEKKQQQQALILEQIHDSVVTTNLDGIITQWNNGATQMYEFTPEEAIGQSFHILYPESTLEQLQEIAIRAVQDGSCKQEIQMKTKSGKLIQADSSFSPLIDDGHLIGIIGSSQNITEKKEVEMELKKQTERLNHQAYHDHLTNLPNRLLFEDRLEQSIIKRDHESFALLFIDLDNFKEINDTLGHHIGDKVLQNISKKLSTCVRIEDSLSRLGGDEFTVILQNIKTPTSAAEVAQKLLDLISTKMIVNNHEIYLSASIGISLCPKDATSKSDLLKFADSAMYKAKESGKNGYQFYSSDMTAIAFEKIMLQNSMRIAIVNHEFQVYYQPQMDGVNDVLIGMEALVRWSHPDLGMIPPYKFIPLAEESGFIIHLDNYVMKQAMQDFTKWEHMDLNPGKLSLNLSMKQLNHDDFINYLSTTANEIGFNLQWLELEITETQMMQDPLSSIEKLNILSELGIEIAIDDFGTGYSSLAYLKRLPVDRLKIDKSFVDNLPDDDEDNAISKAVIALAKSLNLKLIAEGVEHEKQKDFLIESGCNHIQGYYYSKPLPKDEMEQFLKRFK